MADGQLQGSKEEIELAQDPSFVERQKELARLEWQQEKQAKRKQAKQEEARLEGTRPAESRKPGE